MANTFFGFDTAFNNENHLLPDDDADLGEGEEDEYDALNDETFGTLGDSSALNDDWEEQHQQYACYDENSKHSEHIENSIRDLVLNDSDDDDVPTAKKKPQTLAGWYNQPAVPPQMSTNIMQQQQLQFAQQQQRQQQHQQQQKNGNIGPGKMEFPNLPNIPTVEEIEKMYASSKMQFQQMQNQQNIQKRPGLPPGPLPPGQPPMNRFPPGFHPVPPNAGPPQGQPRSLPPGLQPPQGQRMPPGFPPGMRPPPGGSGQFPMPPMMRPGMPGMPPMNMPHPPGAFPSGGGGYHNFPMPPTIRNGPPPTPAQLHQMRQHHQHQMHLHHMQQRHQMQMNHQQQMNQGGGNRVMGASSGGASAGKPKDEYDGLMTNREKQWLLNIQHLQLNTGTPYFDDYYYTVFKERQARNDKENQQMPRHNHGQHPQRHRTHSERSAENNQLQARTYTPLQFENSLGKLQCVSVTAPRKIIDTDVVTLEKDSDGGTPARDTRKTKQLLLDLESLYALTLRAEDLLNPLAIANMEKLVELRQKQRLREMDAAATPEAKRELLRLLQVESAPTTDTPGECVLRIMAGLLQEEKFAAFMNIRKGKMLLLRLLPLLGGEYTPAEYATLWCKVLLCIPLVGRRDSAGDNLLPRLHPYFKRFVQTSRMQDILGIVGKLEQNMMRPADSRGTPLSHLNKAPLQFVVANKFGVSALVTILVRTEYLISSGNASTSQIDDWAHFVANWADATAGRSMMATPLEVIPRPVFLKHIARFPSFGDDKRLHLERHYVDIN